MTGRGRDEIEQRLIDHEVRLSEAREAAELYAAGRESRQEGRLGQADRRWYRAELVSILAGARTEADLHGLGLSDRVVREARLGETLREAWTRFRPRHLAPPREPDRARGAPPVTTRVRGRPFPPDPRPEAP